MTLNAGSALERLASCGGDLVPAAGAGEKIGRALDGGLGVKALRFRARGRQRVPRSRD